jgi:hypothetical protein
MIVYFSDAEFSESCICWANRACAFRVESAPAHTASGPVLLPATGGAGQVRTECDRPAAVA